MLNERCSAKRVRTFKEIAIADGLCGKRDGASTCPKYASSNTYTVAQDFYSSSALFDEEESDLYSQAVIDNLDNDNGIPLAKVKFYRYVKRAGGIAL